MPFQVPGTELPAPVPTIEEILITMFQQDRHLTATPDPGHLVTRVGDHFVAKFGRGMSFLEGNTMLFLAQVTTISVPKVYAMFSEHGCDVILMEYIEGRTLGSALWSGWSSMQKQRFAVVLWGYYGQMQGLPAPGYYGGVGRQPFSHDGFRRCNPSDPADRLGPFDSATQYISALARRMPTDEDEIKAARFSMSSIRHIQPREDRIAQLGESFFGPGPLHFTHGDLCNEHILVTEGLNGPTVYLLDFECAGWH